MKHITTMAIAFLTLITSHVSFAMSTSTQRSLSRLIPQLDLLPNPNKIPSPTVKNKTVPLLQKIARKEKQKKRTILISRERKDRDSEIRNLFFR